MKKKLYSIIPKLSPALLAFFMVIVFHSCQKNIDKQVLQPKSTETYKTSVNKLTAESCDGIHFTYEGEDGPEHWGELCSAWAACGVGKAQSPVNISHVVADRSLRPLDFDWGRTTTNIINNGHTIQFNIDAGNRLTANGKSYELAQFHFHHVSEHTINGKDYPLEMHFVHNASDGTIAVVAVMFVKGRPNPLFNRFLQHFPTTTNGTYVSSAMINLRSLLPKDLRYYNYQGSLTTPACSEVVNWLVLKGFVEASENQIQQLAQILHDNHRPLQALNGRIIRMSTEGKHDHEEEDNDDR